MFGLLTKVLKHYLIFIFILTIVCIGVFPFVILYPTSLLIGSVLDTLLRNKNASQKIDRAWDVLGAPYEYLLKKLEA
jgi:hypothetical protein